MNAMERSIVGKVNAGKPLPHRYMRRNVDRPEAVAKPAPMHAEGATRADIDDFRSQMSRRPPIKGGVTKLIIKGK